MRNTLQETVLERVGVAMGVDPEEAQECGLELVSVVPINVLAYDVPGSVWVVWKASAAEVPSATFSCTLKFISKEVDPATGLPEEDGYDDEYEVWFTRGFIDVGC